MNTTPPATSHQHEPTASDYLDALGRRIQRWARTALLAGLALGLLTATFTGWTAAWAWTLGMNVMALISTELLFYADRLDSQP